MIRIENLSKIYHNGSGALRAVDKVDLSIGRGEFAFITGRSGSGKTTLLSLIGGLTRPTSGTIEIDGMDLRRLDDKQLSAFRARKIGFIFQFASLIPTLTVLDNVLLPATFLPKPTTDGRGTAMGLLERVGLTEKAKSYPAELSGGQQRRVAIARAFINGPDIVLADEPTGDLDEETEAEAMEVLNEENKKGTTLVVVTHNLDLPGQPTKRLVMSRGKLSASR